MKHLEWFTALAQSQVLNAIVPMQWQPGLPFPVWMEEQMLLYVPYQRVWTDGKQAFCSCRLAEAWFHGSNGRLTAFTDLCTMQHADPFSVLATCTLTDDAVYRSNLIAERLLMQLDAFERSRPDKKSISAYDKLLESSLLFPEQLSLYEGVMQHADHRL